MAWTNPRTWTAGERLTAALLNLQVRDNLKAIGDPWDAYTPSWTAATTNPSVGNGSLVGAVRQMGSLVHFRLLLTAGSSTTFGSGAWKMTLPVIPAPGRWIFNGGIRTNFTFPIYGEALDGSLDLQLRRNPASAAGQFVSASQGDPVTMSAGHTLGIAGTFEAA